MLLSKTKKPVPAKIDLSNLGLSLELQLETLLEFRERHLRFLAHVDELIADAKAKLKD